MSIASAALPMGVTVPPSPDDGTSGGGRVEGRATASDGRNLDNDGGVALALDTGIGYVGVDARASVVVGTGEGDFGTGIERHAAITRNGHDDVSGGRFPADYPTTPVLPDSLEDSSEDVRQVGGSTEQLSVGVGADIASGDGGLRSRRRGAPASAVELENAFNRSAEALSTKLEAGSLVAEAARGGEGGYGVMMINGKSRTRASMIWISWVLIHRQASELADSSVCVLLDLWVVFRFVC